jgi:hypothetical protein
MEKFNEFHEPLSASADDDNLPPPQADELGSETMLADRLRRIREYLDSEFCNASSRNAALRSVAADLMELETYLAQLLRDAMRPGTMTLDDVEAVKPAIDLAVGLAKQISQIAKLEGRSSGPSLTLPYPPR